MKKAQNQINSGNHVEKLLITKSLSKDQSNKKEEQKHQFRKRNYTLFHSSSLKKQRIRMLGSVYSKISEKNKKGNFYQKTKSNEKAKMKQFGVMEKKNKQILKLDHEKKYVRIIGQKAQQKQVIKEKQIKIEKEKLQRFLIYKSEQIFLDQYQKYRQKIKILQPSSILFQLLRILYRCEDQKAKLLEKKNQKLIRQNQEKIYRQVQQLQVEISSLKKQLNGYTVKEKIDQQAQTEELKYKQIEQISNGQKISKIITKFREKIHQFQLREIKFIKIMFILRQSGINVEKAFDDLDNLDVNTSKNEDFESFIQSISTIKFSQNNETHDEDSYFADESIVSTINAISFHYNEKEVSIEQNLSQSLLQADTSKKETKSMKKKLKLRFDLGQIENNSVSFIPTC